jgi:hypothetical protein
MSVLTLQPQLMEELEEAATAQAVLVPEPLETAVRAYLRQIEREKIQTEAEAFRAMHAELREKYLGQYVALHERQVVDHDPDFQSLHHRIRQRFGRRPVLLRRVDTGPERTLIFRSPRLERNRL